MSKYSIGDKVELHNTDDIVTIKSIIDENNYLIEDNQGDVKLIHKNKIKLNSDEEINSKSTKKVKKEKSKFSRYTHIKDKSGKEKFYIAFEFLSRDEEDGFIPYIVNKSGTQYEFKVNVRHGKYTHLDDEMILPAYQAVKLQFLSTKVLSAPTTLQLHLTQYYTDGSKDKTTLKTKLKPRHFRKEAVMDKCLNKRIIQRELKVKKSSNSADKLKKFAKTLERDDDTTDLKTVDINNPEQTASFNTELDLHLHKLVSDPDEYSASEALKLQLDELRKYIDQAYQLALRSVIIIHGKGKGRLRKEIQSLCYRDSRIQGCESGYNTGYDHGATEVFFN